MEDSVRARRADKARAARVNKQRKRVMQVLLSQDAAINPLAAEEDHSMKRLKVSTLLLAGIIHRSRRFRTPHAGPRRVRPSGVWDKIRRDVYRMFGQDGFRRYFRMSETSFTRLAARLSPSLQCANVAMARMACEEEVGVEVRLCIALRFLAGSSMKDLCIIFEVAESTAYDAVWRTVDAVNSHPEMEFKFPETEQERAVVAHGFKNKSKNGVIDKCIGAVDGVHFSMLAPSRHDAAKFFCPRKDKYALLAQSICDHKRRFTYVVFRAGPRQHDWAAWSLSDKASQIKQTGLGEYYLVGDAAYVNSKHMMVPTGFDADFDFFQSQVRMNIECAFGMLIRRWGILWRPLACAFQRRVPLLCCLMKLHNFCIDENDCGEMHSSLVALQSNERYRECIYGTDSDPKRQNVLPRLHDATSAIGDAAGTRNNSIPTDDSPVRQSRSPMPSEAERSAAQDDGAVRDAVIKRIHDLNMRRPVR